MSDRKTRVRKSNSEISSSSSSSTSSFSSDEETDNRDLKPIRGYLLNRRELARQLFKSVKGDKIRMMLPQILKNMNLSDLEEWCSSELCGMSEARILSIVNGQPMLDSSDISETDDSGPSLEIISDTEEWLTDTDVPIKEEPSCSGAPKSKKIKVNKSKGKNSTMKKNEIDKTRAKAKGKANSGSAIDTDVKVKKEMEKDNRTATNKEGESLLDLLELEMRARAIRALIRKEEDIIPSAASEKRMEMTATALRNTLNSAVSASLSSEKNLNGEFNIGETTTNKSDKNSLNELGRSAKPAEAVDDEDVVFVVAQPTPMIELLSSDNDEENDNKKKEEKKKESDATSSMEMANPRENKNEKIPEITLSRENAVMTNERIVTIDKSSDGLDNLKIVITKRVSESSNSSSPSKSGKSKKKSIEGGEKSIAGCSAIANEKTSEKTVAATGQSGKGLFKKIKKKQHLRNKRKVTIEDSNIDRDTVEKSSEGASVEVNEIEKSLDSTISTATEAKSTDSNDKEIAEAARVPDVSVVKLEVAESKEPGVVESVLKIDEREVKRKAKRRITLDEDRLDDFEEIIDLDNYSDDMDEMESNSDLKLTNDEADTTKDKPVQLEQKAVPEDGGVMKEPSDSSETWATRYYQTDDVQNVIKESKIQSEIRKRLRERQRQSKLNSSPKLISPIDSTVASNKIEEKIEPKPTGSVEEYLALKSVSASTTDDAVAEKDKSPNGTEVSDVNHENSTPSPEENIDALSTNNSTQEPLNELISTETTEVH